MTADFGVDRWSLTTRMWSRRISDGMVADCPQDQFALQVRRGDKSYRSKEITVKDFLDGNVRLLIVAGARPASTAASFTSSGSRNRIAGVSRSRLRYGDGDTGSVSALGDC